MQGATTGDLALVQKSLQMGAHIEHIDPRSHNTALILACLNSNFQVMKYLVEIGAQVNVNSYNHGLWTPLAICAHKKNLLAVKFLLDKGADINYVDSALARATANGDFQMVQFLINKNADFTMSLRNMTPLTIAAEAGNLKMVKYLVENGAPVNFHYKFSGDRGALIHAIKGGTLSVGKYLVEQGAKVKLGRRRCPLIESVKYNTDPEMLKYLIKTGVDVNLIDYKGRTALVYAAESGNLIHTRILLDNGAKINRRSKITGMRDTALSIAVKKENFEMVKYLLNAGACLNTSDAYKQTPLMAACRKGNLKLVKLLIKYGASVNYLSRTYRTDSALLYAFENRNLEVVKLIIESGGKINVIKNYIADGGFVPPNCSVLKYLRNHGL